MYVCEIYRCNKYLGFKLDEDRMQPERALYFGELSESIFRWALLQFDSIGELRHERQIMGCSQQEIDPPIQRPQPADKLCGGQSRWQVGGQRGPGRPHQNMGHGPAKVSPHFFQGHQLWYNLHSKSYPYLYLYLYLYLSIYLYIYVYVYRQDLNICII